MDGFLTQHILYIVMGVAFFVYTFLYGPILGSGSVFPLLAKEDHERKAILHSVAPFWDGAGVWLIAAAVVMWGAFPQSYATLFGGFFLALFIVLVFLLLSIASIELYIKDETRRNFWKNAYFVGNLVPSLLFGVALGNVVMGIPLNEELWYTGDFFTLLRPYALLVGLLGFTILITHAMGYILIKVEGEVIERAQNVLKISNSIFLMLFVIFVFWTHHMFEGLSIFYWIVSALIVLLSAAMFFVKSFHFWVSTLILLLSWILIGLIQYPFVIRGLSDNGITLFNNSSSPVTQTAMIVILAVGLPFVILYTYYSYFVFRGKFSGKEQLY
ncbi:MAG: cytochrome d ubiquinol oxidase subunit II [Candidatus Calescibacterium sp.]|nr:cytochrome d ubiquinol oxidase subunit II [Candidatus Calescibacterium sp.]MDW8132145.1 cytochrome d ubiquinol oxidase subunit II [Candidatus Calescibacterium sp.]